MYRFLQNHGKKLMAVFSAVLMIAFALPSFRSGAGGAGTARPAGTIDGKTIYATEVANAKHNWQLLTHTPFGPQGRSFVDIVLPPSAIAQIERRPILFYLLQKDAERMGAAVSTDLMNSVTTNNPMFNSGNADKDDELKAAMAQLLLVRQGMQRASSIIKISEPMREHRLAESGQTINLSVADFTSAQYASKVPAPTADQLKTQFEKFAGLIKGGAFGDNPFGFGYKYPDRVKLQYISVPRAAVRDAVEHFNAPGKPKDPYEWEVEGQKYYRQHETEFPSTQPVAPKAGQFDLTAPSPTSRSTTRPYAEVASDIKRQLIDKATDQREQQIQERITGTLAKDWSAYRAAANGATRPTTVPASSLNAPYDSLEYLQKLAAEIQSAYGVLPTIKSIQDTWQTTEDLSKLQGISGAYIMGTNRPLTMPLYVMTYSAAFVPAEQQSDTGVLHEMEPSRPLEDEQQTIYFVRVTGAQPTHKPETLAEVEPLVKADCISKSAYDLAKADAANLLEAARKSGLSAAASGKSLISVGPLTLQRAQTIKGLTLSPMVQDEFLTQAFKLLATPSSRPSGKPVEMIELQPDGRVLVAELTSYEATWQERFKSSEEAQINLELQRMLFTGFAVDWFNYDSVASRLKYVPDANSKEQDAGPSEPMQPIF